MQDNPLSDGSIYSLRHAKNLLQRWNDFGLGVVAKMDLIP
jgi:hypothetical protein